MAIYVINSMEQKVTKQDLESVLRIMNFYNRNDGYIGFVDTKLMFFDAKPESIGGAYITKKEIEQAITEY